MKTLGNYRDLCAILGGEDNRAVEFFDEKIANQGREETVIADESQMMSLIKSMILKPRTNPPEKKP